MCPRKSIFLYSVAYERLEDKLKRRSFGRQLLQSYLVIAILPISFLIFYLLYDVVNTAFSDAQNQVNNTAKFISSQFESQYTNLSFLSINTLSDDDFRFAAQRLSSDDTVGEQINYHTVEETICTYAIADSIYDISFFNDNGYYATSIDYNHGYTSHYRLPEQEKNAYQWTDTAKTNYGQEILLPISDNLLPEHNERVLALVRSIRNPGKIVGYLIVEVKEQDLDYIFNQKSSYNEELSIITESGDEIYRSDGFPSDYPAGNYYLYSEQTDENGITTRCLVRKNQVIIQAASVLRPLILACVFLITVTVFGIKRYGKKLAAPIADLAEMMESTTISNLEQTTDTRQAEQYEQYEEIATLFNHFQRMRERLSTMMQKEILMRTLNARERLHSLQAQINPHFLYNTLNVIGIMGMETGSEDIYDSCFKLSSIMRYSIADKNSELNTLQEEIKNVRSFLDLMKLRYEHRVNYRITIAPELMDLQIPHLTVQPFVENIFEHAYDDSHTSLNIDIQGKTDSSRWYLTISDNGTGIPEKKLAELLADIEQFLKEDYKQSYNDENTKFGIGVKNTIARLKLHFGEDFLYDIQSPECSGGTFITLSSTVR